MTSHDGPNWAVRCRVGDYVRIELFRGPHNAVRSVWIKVECCDDIRSIVYGTIEDKQFQGFGNSLKPGARLAASYERIVEHQEAA